VGEVFVVRHNHLLEHIHRLRDAWLRHESQDLRRVLKKFLYKEAKMRETEAIEQLIGGDLVVDEGDVKVFMLVLEHDGRETATKAASEDHNANRSQNGHHESLNQLRNKGKEEAPLLLGFSSGQVRGELVRRTCHLRLFLNNIRNVIIRMIDEAN